MGRNYSANFRRAFLLRDRQRAVARMVAVYQTEASATEIEATQVRRFNEVWRKCLVEVPFYQRWARQHRLPPAINTTSDLLDFPVLTKRDIADNAEEIFLGGEIQLAYSTGGTTGTPTRYPRGAGEETPNYANTYAGRSWWGIKPFDRYVHLWGHSHLFGQGTKGRIAKLKRHALDQLVNATRLNAYDMTEDALQRHYEDVRVRKPSYVVGYTSTITKLAHHIEANNLAFDGPRLKAVIVTAETLALPDAEVIGRVFQAPVVTEYGSAETGTLAVSRGGTWPLQVFWNSFILTVTDDGSLTVSTLEDRVFPLINYGIGDVVTRVPAGPGNALQLQAVHGRTQDLVRVATTDGRTLELSAILPVHILKGHPQISAVQFRQASSTELQILLHARSTLSIPEVSAYFAQTMRKEHALFDESSVTIQQIDQPILTKAGKHALFVP